MKDLNSRPWIVFTGCVLVVAVLYFAQTLLVPIAVAVLLTFLLAPPVAWLERWLGRVPAILVVVALAFSLLGLGTWGLAQQIGGLAADLPSYRSNIRQKIADIRGAGQGGSVEQIQQAIEDIQREVSPVEPSRATATSPTVVVAEQVAGMWGLPIWLTAALEPLATAGLIVALVIFMLWERKEFRDRLIGLIGYSHLPATTKAFDEAATRVSDYLLRQTLVNLLFGIGVAVGLYFIGVPYWALWATLAGLLRFIPYVGPWIGASAPILVSLATLSGWTKPLLVVALFVGLEVFTNLILETYLFAGAAGVSQVALLVAVAFWTWLWGPFGLLLATPLTVCLVVIGKHVPGLEFVTTLMADMPVLAPDVSYYQRLLAHDEIEAVDLLERHLGEQAPESVYDALMIPALNYAKHDRLENRLSPDEEAAVIDTTRELLADAALLVKSGRRERESDAADRTPRQPSKQVSVFGYPSSSESDELALRMLAQLLEDTPIELEIASSQMLASEVIAHVLNHDYTTICIADLPPSPSSKTRYLVKKLRSLAPHLRIVVGRWAPTSMKDDDFKPLLDVGATAVASTLLETCTQLRQIAHLHPPTAVRSTVDVA